MVLQQMYPYAWCTPQNKFKICGCQLPRDTPMISVSYSSHSVQSLSTFYWSWSICPLEYGRNHDITLLRMGYKRPCSFPCFVSQLLCLSLSVSLSPLTLLETRCHVVSSPMKGLTGESLEPPTNSHLSELATHFKQLSLHMTVAPGVSLTETS